MTKRSLFLILSLALSLTFLLTACQKTQTAPTEQNTAPITSSTQGEKPETAPAVSDLPTAENTDGLSKQCTAVPTCAYLLGNIPNPLTISEKLATHCWC